MLKVRKMENIKYCSLIFFTFLFISCSFQEVGTSMSLQLKNPEYYSYYSPDDFFLFLELLDSNKIDKELKPELIQVRKYILLFEVENTTAESNWILFNNIMEIEKPSALYRRRILNDNSYGDLESINLSYIPEGNLLFNTHFAMEQFIQPGSRYEYYIINGTPKNVVYNLNLYNYEMFYRFQKNQNLYSGFTHGIMLLVIIFCLGCSIVLKNKTFLYFSLLVAMSTLVYMIGDGTFTYVYGRALNYLEASIIQAILVISYVVFSANLLALRKRIPKISLIVYIAVILYSFLVIFDGIKPALASTFLFRSALLISVVCILLIILVYAFFLAIKKRDKAAIFYLIGLSPVTFIELIRQIILVVWNVEIGISGIGIGLNIMCIIMPLAVFYQIKNIQVEKEKLIKDIDNKIKNNLNLKKIDDLKNNLIANITHEYKSPIAGIIRLADAVLKFDISQDKKNEYIETICNTANKLQLNTDKLLELIKLKDTSPGLELRELDIEKKISSIVKDFQAMLPDNGIKIYNKISPISPPILLTDEYKFEEIVNNLLSNAIKAIKADNGSITIEYYEDDHIVRVVVTDNGIGIKKSELENIFLKFSTGSNSNKENSSGLGLYHCRMMMKLLNGRIWAESEKLGSGASFFLEFMKSNK